MDWLIKLFSDHETVAYTVLVYSFVIATGVVLGKIKVFGVSFGIACVLFMGIFVSHFGFTVNEHILHFIKDFGLILFVYTIGLQVGPGFFASFKKEGIKLNTLAIVAVLMSVLTVIVIHFVTGTHIVALVGIMSGAVTNTPGLAGAQQTLGDLMKGGTSTVNPKDLSTGYAIAYPFGVLGIIIVMLGIKSLFKINVQAENRLNTWKRSSSEPSLSRIVLEVKNPTLFNKPLKTLWQTLDFNFVVSRIYQDGSVHRTRKDMILHEGNVLLIVASSKDFEKLKNLIGEESTMDLTKDDEGKEVVSRRINVTQKAAYSKRLADLDIISKYGTTITRVFRSGVEFIPDGNTKLQFGDTITAIGEEGMVEAMAKDFGNSKKKLQTPHIAELFAGIILGVLLGSIPIHFPGIPVPIKLGLAGGPLIVAILISRYGGKFSVTYYVSQSANLMVREIGIVLFLASVGLGAGESFVETLTKGDGLIWMGYGAIITLVPLLVTATLARFYYKLNYLEICGLLAGASTDPPALAFAHQSTGSDAPAITYASVYPLTTFLRIMVAQLLLLLFFQ